MAASGGKGDAPGAGAADGRQSPARRGGRADDRFARQSAALRENLRKRKRQARERADAARGSAGADAGEPPRG